MRRRMTAKIVAAALAAIMLAGCGAGQSAESPTAQKNEEESNNPGGSAADEGTMETAKGMTDVKPPAVAGVEIEQVMPDRPLKFAFLCFQNNPFWQMVRSGADMGAEYLGNFDVSVDYIVVGDVLDAETINAGLDAAIVQGYDGICVTPFAPGTEAYIDKAVDAGIPVVTLYGESPLPSKRMAFLGQDAYAAGESAGKYIEENSDGPGKFAVITGQFTVENHEQRRKGCEEYLIGKGWESVGSYEAMDKADLTYSYAKDIMTSNPDIKAIYMTAGGPFGAARAAEEMERDDVLIVGHDEVPENLEYVSQGKMVVVSQDISGVSVNGLITLYNKVVAGVDPEEDFMPSKSVIITRDNVSEFQ